MRRRALVSLVAVVAILGATAIAGAEEGFTSLFDGKTLDGWEQHGGKVAKVK